MKLIEEIDKYLKETLSERRYRHSVGVMERAAELAKIYGIDEEKAKVCGLAHDIAKEMTAEESLRYIEENAIEIDEVERVSTGLLHGKIGADIVKKKYGFDEEMQKAIAYHTTTNPEMDILAKIVYVADKTEYGRQSKKYDVEYEREIANKDINEAMLYIIAENTKRLLEQNKLIHPKCIETRNKIIQERTQS